MFLCMFLKYVFYESVKNMFLMFFYVQINVFNIYVRNYEKAGLVDAFETKRLRKILGVSWTAKKTDEWVLNKAGVKSELLNTVKARKLAYYGHPMRKQGSCLEKEIMQGTMPGACIISFSRKLPCFLMVWP